LDLDQKRDNLIPKKKTGMGEKGQNSCRRTFIWGGGKKKYLSTIKKADEKWVGTK